MALCSKNYVDNRCSPPDRIPAMEATCITWENCMTRDPKTVGRARVSAETFAEILNSFVEPISYKTMAFFGMVVFGFTFLSNFAFQFARSRWPLPFPSTTVAAGQHAGAMGHLHGGPGTASPASTAAVGWGAAGTVTPTRRGYGGYHDYTPSKKLY